MKPLIIFSAVTAFSVTAAINSPVLADKPVKPDTVVLYSVPLIVEDGIGCQHQNTTQKMIDVKIELLDQYGNLSGGGRDILMPQASGADIFYALSGSTVYACKWTYEGNANDLRAVVVTYRQVEGKLQPQALIAVPAIANVNVPKNQVARD